MSLAKYCYFNGSVVEFDAVKINPYDLGFMRGYGIFDAMRTTDGKLFCLDEHWNKFENSAQELSLNLTITKDEFEKIVLELGERNNLKELAIKTILTGGVPLKGLLRSDKSTFLILVDDLNSLVVSDDAYVQGWKIISLEHQRFLPEIKTLNYLFPIKNQDKKIENDAQEILYTKNDYILECSTSNIFMLKDEVLITPKDDIFQGTVRNLVLAIARKNDIKVEERSISKEEFFKADEVFLSATYKKIIPVVQVDDQVIGSGEIGEKTKELMLLLNDFMKNYS